MAYVSVKGGKEAIQQAELLLNYYRLKDDSLTLQIKQIRGQLRFAVDKVMGEGSLYDPDLAALALKQAEGDAFEASFLIRAFRSTLSRNHYSLPIDTNQMEIIRRISAAFKDIPGGQYLGPTRDYTRRLLNFELNEENDEQVKSFVANYLKDVDSEPTSMTTTTFPKVIDILREQGLLKQTADDKPSHEVKDLTRESMQFPVSRDMRLQALARGETGAMMALAYSSNRGYGNIHPTLGELRVGYVKVSIPHPLYEGEEITIGKVLVTEAEIISKVQSNRKDASGPEFSLGFGLCFGHNEIKAISMGTLDRAMDTTNPQAPAEDEEFVLYHIDGIDASGFVSHWKLPHYVTFQSSVNKMQSVQNQEVKSR